MREMTEKEISEGRWRYRDKQCRLELNTRRLLLRQFIFWRTDAPCTISEEDRIQRAFNFQITFRGFFFLVHYASTNGVGGIGASLAHSEPVRCTSPIDMKIALIIYLAETKIRWRKDDGKI